MTDLILKPGRELPVRNRHPWIFSGSVAELSDLPSAGETVTVRDHKGDFIAWAGYSPQSQIRARVWSWNPDESIDKHFFQEKLISSINRREHFDLGGGNARRLVHAESDGLPGLILDQYGETIVIQLLFCGIERFRDNLIEILDGLPGIERIYERSDSEVRSIEGLDPASGLIKGKPFDSFIEILENDIRFLVDIEHGQKTGFYLDQGRNRERLRKFSSGARVLDCYSYTGGFGLNTLMAGASSVTAIDSSADAIAIGRQNQHRNGIPQNRIDWIQGDVPTVLRRMRDRDQKFDLIILDPPKFAPTASRARKAARAYKDINLLAFKLLEPGGILATFSCSGGISAEFFQKVVGSAASDAGTDAQIIERLWQGSDHPVNLSFPEGDYLKGLICIKN